MTNHNPTITSSNATGSFSENTNTTGSSALHTLSGTMNFTDSDHSDTHTTSASLKTAVVSSGTIIPATSLAHLNSAMSSIIQSDSNGSGKLKWTFNDADSDFDFLAKNQTLTLTYEIKVSDNHGGSTTKTVTLTVTGTDDKPVIDFGTQATVTEQAGHTLSISPDTAHIAVHFVDPDLANTGHTATVTGVSASGATGGLLPGFLGQAELMAFFHVDNVVKTSGSSNGTINTTFSAPDLAFDYLGQGDSLDITYTLQIDDHAGGITTQTVLVTVVGTNDAPLYISCPDTEHLTEGQDLSSSGDLHAHGDLLFGDIDLSDMHTASTTVTATRSGGGAIPVSNADLLAAFSTSVHDSTGHLVGDVDWNFALDNDSVSFLSAGETLTLTYNIQITDDAGGSDTQTVTITILGTNHPVTFTSGPESASLSETADITGSPDPDTTSPVPTGTLTFTDQDLGDTHTVQVAVDSTAVSGGATVPADTLSALSTALLTTLNDSTGSGTGGVDWTFSIADNNLDFLSAGETLTINYNVTVSDGSTSSTQTVTVTVDGANDATVFTSGPESGSVAEQENMTGSPTPDTATPDAPSTGTLSFSDVDLDDVHSVSVAVNSYAWSTGSDIPFATQSDLAAALSTILYDSTGSGSGSVDWTFSIADADLDFLSAGETLTIYYDVTVSDGFTSSTQTVTIVATGAEDALVVNPVEASVFDTVLQDTGSVVAAGNVITDGGDSSGDAGAVLSVTDVNGSGSNVDNFVAGAYGDLLVSSDGSYIYLANANLDPLRAGDSADDQFTLTVSDSFGRSEATTLTFHVSGANDAAVITGGVTTGTMTEDLGPTVMVNGGFESGDLTGWSASTNVQVQFEGLGGEFGDYDARLAASTGPLADNFITQNVSTTAGQHYTLSFLVSGDTESTSNLLIVNWDGENVLALSDNFSGEFTRYNLDVVGGASLSTLTFNFGDDGTGLRLDQISVNPTSGPATESADGSVTFSDPETADTHSASFVPQGGDYVGTFSLDLLSESGGSGSVGWHFTVNNSDIQFLAQDQVLSQTYTVFVTDDQGASTAQDVTVSMIGTNDAPTAVGETVITNVGANGTVDIPLWALGANEFDPDTTDTHTANSIVSSSGGSATLSSNASFTDDATPGGSFDYTVTDGHATSSNAATATIVNNATGTIALVGTGGDDILIGNNGSESLSGGGGNDVLIGNSGSHVLTGGTGDDMFAFVAPSDGPNTITDFNNVTAHDTVAIAASGFSLTAGQDPSTVFESSDDDQFFGSLFHYDNTNQTLYYSADGTTASATVLAQFQAGVLLHANDLVIV